MRDLLPTIGTVLAALASLAAVVVAVEQFTLRSRMRRVLTWTTELLEAETSPQRTAALTEVRDRAASSIVAASMVSSRYVLEGAFWLLGGAAVTMSVWAESRDVWFTVGSMVVVLLASLAFVGRVVRQYVERERIRREYLGDQTVSSPRQVTTGAQRAYAALLIGGFQGLAFGIAWALTDVAAALWPTALITAGGFALVVAAAVQAWSLWRKIPRVEDHFGPEMSEALAGRPRRDPGRDEA